MKVKTSVSISTDVMERLREYTSDGNRSEFIEKAILQYFELLRKNIRDKRDLDLINAGSAHLNEEALDALSFQAPW